MKLRRRDLLATTALFLGSGLLARAGTIGGELPWWPNAGSPPEPFRPGPWTFFSPAEGAALEAIADRIIPPDAETPGGKDTGSAVFIDRQLAGPYGRQEGLYVRPPFLKGTKQQGPQSAAGPAKQYREGLDALDRYCRGNHGGKAFADLADADKDAVLSGLESGTVDLEGADGKAFFELVLKDVQEGFFADLADADKDAVLSGLESGTVDLEGADGKAFFELVLKDVQEGFFADPIYGGNRDMAGWRMIGYPGARYDYRDWVSRHNEPFPLPPVSIAGRADWTPRKP
jgi:gluconate 2-dehydrogenase gamma chain